MDTITSTLLQHNSAVPGREYSGAELLMFADLDDLMLKEMEHEHEPEPEPDPESLKTYFRASPEIYLKLWKESSEREAERKARFRIGQYGKAAYTAEEWERHKARKRAEYHAKNPEARYYTYTPEERKEARRRQQAEFARRKRAKKKAEKALLKQALSDFES